MGNIVLLDDLTINKIAAGEVIERPASVVKEMVENSIDAGATNINIEVQNGGISKIRISDNGKGIEPDDMVIAFERHATSKIRQADDLEYVRTMGFRGEALASIAAISRVEMISRTQNNETGYKVVVEGGNIISEEMTACPVGTTITVEKLFFNTPVRYKFLKKDYTEAGYIEDAVKRITLVNPNIAIKLISNGKSIIQTNGNGKLEDVIYGIYGKEIVENILPIEYEYENIKIKGVIGKPEIARSNRTNQMFFVNNRYVKDKTLSAAVEQAMKGMLPIGKFPFLVINIEMDPIKVDVNVHPAKLEVRFVDESQVFKAVMHAIKETLLAGSLISNVSKEYEENISIEEKTPELTETKLEPKIETIDNTSEKSLFNNEESKIEPNTEPNIQPTIEPNTEPTEDFNIKPIIDFGTTNKNETSDNIVKTRNQLLETGEIKEQRVTDKTVEYTQQDSQNINEEQPEKPKHSFIDIFKNVKKEFKEEKNTENNPIEQNNKFEEEKADYSNTNPYKFEELQSLQSDVLKEIEKMPVLTNETVNETVNETANKTASASKQETQNFETMYEKTFGEVPTSVKRQEAKFDNLKYVESDNISMFTKNDKYRGYRYIGTAFSTYIILEIENELYILDQHAAHERIMYEKVKANYYSGNKDCQMMLLPDVINLTNKEVCILKENREIFEKAGFKVEEFGDKTVKLTGVPSSCMDMDTKILFLDILDELDTVARTERQEAEEKFIATVACKSAVKANMHLEFQEVIELLDRLMSLPNPFTCPHGRPTAIKMTKNDIEKKFSRR